MEAQYRPVIWGRALKAEVDARGGLLHHVNKIHGAVGTIIGSRNTFAKLFDCPAPPDDDTEQLRVLLLLQSLGLDAADWGLADAAIPPALDLKVLAELSPTGPGGKRRDQRKPRTAWIPVKAGQLADVA